MTCFQIQQHRVHLMHDIMFISNTLCLDYKSSSINNISIILTQIIFNINSLVTTYTTYNKYWCTTNILLRQPVWLRIQLAYFLSHDYFPYIIKFISLIRVFKFILYISLWQRAIARNVRPRIVIIHVSAVHQHYYISICKKAGWVVRKQVRFPPI